MINALVMDLPGTFWLDETFPLTEPSGEKPKYRLLRILPVSSNFLIPLTLEAFLGGYKILSFLEMLIAFAFFLYIAFENWLIL